MSPILTIAIPTFRRQTYLLELLQSIDLPPELFSDVEVVVSDNRSPYDVEASIAALNLRYPVRLHVNEVNIGATQNFYNCVSMARGTFVWLIGDDELLLPGKVASVVEALRTHPDCGLAFVSAENWTSSPPFQKLYPNYAEALADLGTVDVQIPLKQTLISVVVFRRADFDYQLAYKTFFSNYGQAFGMFNKAGDRPVLVLSSHDPVVRVRAVRAASDELPPRLVATQVRFLKYLGRRFGARHQVRYARSFLWKNRINSWVDGGLRLWKRVSPKTYAFFQKRFSKKS